MPWISYFFHHSHSTYQHQFHAILGPVYTTVEKSTGHEKKSVSQLWSVENATLDRWVFTLGEENKRSEHFSWMIKWQGCLRRNTFWNWASPASRGRTRNSSSAEAQLNKKYFVAFYSFPAHPPFASNIYVLTKHSWPTGGLLHRSVNRLLCPKYLINNPSHSRTCSKLIHGHCSCIASVPLLGPLYTQRPGQFPWRPIAQNSTFFGLEAGLYYTL